MQCAEAGMEQDASPIWGWVQHGGKDGGGGRLQAAMGGALAPGRTQNQGAAWHVPRAGASHDGRSRGGWTGARPRWRLAQGLDATQLKLLQ